MTLVYAEDRIVTVACETTKGPIRITLNKDWAPIGVARVLELVDDGFFTNHALYRAVNNFLIQFGIAADPELTLQWESRGNLVDDPDQRLAFKPGMLSFAGNGPNSRSTSLFVATSTHPGQLQAFGTQLWETPLGFVTEGLDVLSNVYTGYGDMAEQGGNGPSQRALTQEGNVGLKETYPLLDYLVSCTTTTPTAKELEVVAVANWPKTPPRPIDVSLINKASKEMELFWLPEGGNAETDGIFQETVVPGGSVRQTTFPGHTYVWKRPGNKQAVRTTHIADAVYTYHHEEL